MKDPIEYIITEDFPDDPVVKNQTLMAGIGAIAFVITYAWVGSFETFTSHYFYNKKLDLVPTLLAVLATIVGILIYRYVTYIYDKTVNV
jgi:uncharacterized protein YacL